MNASLRRTAPLLGTLLLGLVLQGCIDSTRDKPTVAGCNDLPTTTLSFKGGNTWGEELTVSLDPATLAYTITIDASLQRTAGTARNGTLTPLEECTYTSEESGAVFTLAPGGVLQGGVNAPSGGGFAPLLAFRETWNNATDPAVFNPVADIHNVIGIHSDGTTAQSYGGSVRLRNAGTLQLCQDPTTGRFIEYNASCTSTSRGYITYDATRNAFDWRTTTGTATTGGTLSGSMVIGMVGSVSVPLQLVRDSSTSYGMRLYMPQPQAPATTPPPGSFDGSYVVIDSSGSNATATLAGTDYSRNGVAAVLTYGSPVAGVLAASGALNGHLLSNAGILGFIPDSGTPVFELGVLN